MKFRKDTDITCLNSPRAAWHANEVADLEEIPSLPDTDSTITHTIRKNDPEGRPRIAEKNFCFPGEEEALLSAREKDVLRYIADGLTSKQIASKLKISENTVGNHRQNMQRKTNTKNVAELVAFCIRKRII